MSKSPKKETQDTVKIYKADESLQCEPNTGLSLEDMAKQLSSIKILSQERKHDGKIRITLCGAPTGYVNIYEIKQDDLAKANDLGFKILKN